MQTVPSLIGSGTAVAAATTGLVFGQLADGQPAPPARSDSTKRKSLLNPDFTFRAEPSSRPGHKRATTPASPDDRALPSSPTAATIRQLSPASTQEPAPHRPQHWSSATRVTPPRSSSRPPITSLRLPTDPPAEPRDSFSSNSSWLRRMPLRPLSQHGSLRSSVGHDSSSIAFSHTSGVPILSSARQQAHILPPNKLVKRASATISTDPAAAVQLGSRNPLTLRRPATSHQRSATLQQQVNVEALSATLNKTSLDAQSRPRAQTATTNQHKSVSIAKDALSSWKSFWHARIGRQASKNSAFRSSDSTSTNSAKRICLEQGSSPHVYLVKPQVVIMGYERAASPEDRTEPSDPEDSPPNSHKSSASSGMTPSKAPRRSTSLNLSSPTSWVSKTGSLRRRKRGEQVGSGKRVVSGPATSESRPTSHNEEPHDAALERERQPSRAEKDLTAIFKPPKARLDSSPMPPTSRSSSLRADRTPESQRHGDRLPPRTSPSLRVDSRSSQTRSNDRASTVASSEYYRGFTSGEDDDNDMKTDTPYDSFRTVGSNRRKTGDSALDSLFDESPPGSAGLANKSKRLSIQEILGFSWEDGDRIVEEDENASTPVRTHYDAKQSRMRGFQNNEDTDNVMNRDFRISLDDDDDLAWAEEDEMHLYNNLSPPSSTNSRRASPSLRMALSALSGDIGAENTNDAYDERPRSTVFDWVEAPPQERSNGNKKNLRPMTAHGKKDRDGRGGRSSNRKGPTAAHIRSQSVPVAQDPAESAKPTPRFGTWGLGSKNVSEDWDDDFEFEETIPENPAEAVEPSRLSMIVPPSIQATQHTLKAHSGQIRELSLLVNDLKRLCRLRRETEMLNGVSKHLWLEAEDIIALASPDEDTDIDGGSSSNHLVGVTESSGNEGRFIDQGFDGSSLELEDHRSDLSGSKSDARNSHLPAGRRRSVFSQPEDDIFGTWDHLAETQARPCTPDNPIFSRQPSSSTKTMIEAMRTRTHASRSVPRKDKNADLNTRLNFDTNSLKDLVKRASELRDILSDIIRKADRITASPARTPRRGERADGSPAFTRVFDEPTSNPSKRPHVVHSNSTSSFNSNSLSTSPSTGLSQRMHMMTVG